MSVAEDIIKNSGAALWTRDQYFKAWDASTPNESEFLFRLNAVSYTHLSYYMYEYAGVDPETGLESYYINDGTENARKMCIRDRQ